MRKEKGITLIALVITIIVLLILAGVAIAMLSGENGILKKAADAKEKTTEGKRDEASKLAQYEGLLNNYSGKRWSLATDASGKVIGVTDGKTTIKLGAQINYDPYTGVEKDYLKVTTSKTKNGYEDQTFEIKDNDKQKLIWQVLGVDNNGQILIMPTTNVKDEKGEIQNLHLGSKLAYDESDYTSEESQNAGKLGAQYGAEEVNNVCSIYGFGKGAAGARSVQVEDIDNLTKFDKTTYQPTQVYGYGHDVTYSLESGKINYQWGTTSKTASSYTSFTYLDGNEWKTLSAENPSKTLKSTYYSYSMSGDPYKTNLGDAYDLITKNTGNNEDYWLGSSCVDANSGSAFFGVRYVYISNVSSRDLFYSYGRARGVCFGLRPAVSLKSDVTLKETEENSGIYDIQ